MYDQEFKYENPYKEKTKEKQEGIDDDFIEVIKSVRQIISSLKNNNFRIQSIKGKYAKAIKSSQQHANSEQMNQILKQNSNYHQAIKQKLTLIEQKVKVAEQTQPNEPETKMKKNFYLSLSKEVNDVLQIQQEYQIDYRNTVKDKVTRQVRLVDKDITEEEMEQFVNNPQLAQEMLQKKIYGQASTTLKNTVSDIQDKFKDIQKLEQSVNQCVALFNQLAILVQAQGQKIDSIQANVATAKDYVEKAQKKLQKAKQHHKCSKKCLCIGIVIGLVLLIIVIIIIATQVNK